MHMFEIKIGLAGPYYYKNRLKKYLPMFFVIKVLLEISIEELIWLCLIIMVFRKIIVMVVFRYVVTLTPSYRSSSDGQRRNRSGLQS